jgi:cell division cycle 2-like
MAYVVAAINAATDHHYLRRYYHYCSRYCRPPELLLGEKVYSTGVDMWSVGCIFGEMLRGDALFQGRGEIEQLGKIFSVLGAPTEERWPGWSKLSGAATVKWKTGTVSKLSELFPSMAFNGRCTLSKSGLELLSGLLALDPKQRLSAAAALAHPWFKEFPLAKEQEEMPLPQLQKDA